MTYLCKPLFNLNFVHLPIDWNSAPFFFILYTIFCSYIFFDLPNTYSFHSSGFNKKFGLRMNSRHVFVILLRKMNFRLLFAHLIVKQKGPAGKYPQHDSAYPQHNSAYPQADSEYPHRYSAYPLPADIRRRMLKRYSFITEISIVKWK